ncbi:MAG: amidohydrolase [Acidimicrobiales bacterium]|nr:amidohydrolase [Acidimicrobiales bacterium]
MIPKIISVDDHVVEPPDLWTERLPERWRDAAPHVERDRVVFQFNPQEGSHVDRGNPDGEWCDFWCFEGQCFPFPKTAAWVGLDSIEWTPVTYDQLHPATWQQGPRLAAMDDNHMEASLCFPNTLPRFCGQRFLEAADHELGLACVQVYNDWMIDEWCGGDGRGRLIPLTMVPLWDPHLAAAEVRRCAEKGSFAVTFSEDPSKLGLPSVHNKDRHWDPFFDACEETGTVINMHIGSSSMMHLTTPDAPFIVSSTLTFVNSMNSLVDYLFSGTLARFPGLRIAYSEGQVGWASYVLERADKLYHQRGRSGVFGADLPEPPSTYIRDRVFFCIFDDETGLELRHRVGMEQITFEVDFPHADTTWPETAKIAADICDAAGLDATETHQLLRGNAIRCFGLERYGITP